MKSGASTAGCNFVLFVLQWRRRCGRQITNHCPAEGGDNSSIMHVIIHRIKPSLCLVLQVLVLSLA